MRERGTNLANKTISHWHDRAVEAEAQVKELEAERDHERHEKETVAEAAQAHAAWCKRERAKAEQQATALRDALSEMWASAVPHPKEHPTMMTAWAKAKALLAEANPPKEEA